MSQYEPQYEQMPQEQNTQHSSQKQVSISSIPSLYDLNGKEAIFSLRIHIQAQGFFEYAIASQTDIDNERVAYRQGSNHVVENVSNTTNDYQNYFLLLRSNEPVSGVFWTEQIPQQIPQQVSKVVKTEVKKGNGLSIVLWVALIIGVIFMFNKKKVGGNNNMF